MAGPCLKRWVPLPEAIEATEVRSWWDGLQVGGTEVTRKVGGTRERKPVQERIGVAILLASPDLCCFLPPENDS